MQLSARILTALAVLAFAVAIVAGARSASDDVSAATGTIDALNVGACTSTNADVFNLDNCSQKMAFYQQGAIEDIVEISTLYATYAHDPKTAAEAPRGIIQDGDLIRVSITDKGRDRRDPVLITSDADFMDAGDPYEGNADADSATPPMLTMDAELVVADAVGVKSEELPDLEGQVQFDEGGDDTTFAISGPYEVIFEREGEDGEDDDFKPIASAKDGGVVKFFGRVNDGNGLGAFRDIGNYIQLDEDVISGEEDTQPAMAINVSVPDASGSEVQLQVIYYQTSGIEYIQGSDKCFPDPDNTKGDLTGDDIARAMLQAACTAKEVEDLDDGGRGDAFVLYAESDEDAADDKRHLALVETSRFSGVFQGFLRLTDADGDGGGENWGVPKGSGEYDHDEDSADQTNPSTAVLGVGSGPVSIIYKDTDGKNQRYDIEIDIDPPTIQVDSPAHGGRSDDEKPSFIGSFNDSDSGLAADSFQLDVDNTDDAEDANPVMNVPAGVTGKDDAATGQVRRRLDYTGFGVGSNMFGVIGTRSRGRGCQRLQVTRSGRFLGRSPRWRVQRRNRDRL